MTGIKTIGVLTSGGDCAGLNAVIRAVTDHAVGAHGWRVLGLRNGHLGLLESPPAVVDLTPEGVRGDLLRRGGTFLGTTTTHDPFAYPKAGGGTTDRSAEVVAALAALGIDALVVIGGDGSMRVFDRLCRQGGVRWVGVPKTIDNDVPGTEYAVGFFSAVEVVGQSLDRLASTAASHRRIMVLEVMGRDSGFIALFGGMAGGADVILMPEFPYDLDDVAGHIRRVTHDRPSPVLVVVAEGIKRPAGPPTSSTGALVAAELAARTGFDARCTVLGHLQRGGSPTMFDRLLATAFGVRAVDLLASGASGRLAAWRGGLVTDIPMAEVVTGPRLVPPESQLLNAARGLGIYVGGGPQRIGPKATNCSGQPQKSLQLLVVTRGAPDELHGGMVRLRTNFACLVAGAAALLNLWVPAAQAAEALITPVFSSLQTARGQSFVRLINLSLTARSVTLDVYNYNSGQLLGSCPYTVPGGAAPQYSIGAIENCIGLNPGPQNVQLYSIRANLPDGLYYQHVVYSSQTGYFSNVSSCRDAEQNDSIVTNVHTTQIANYPASITARVVSDRAFYIQLTVIHATTGAHIGTYRSGNFGPGPVQVVLDWPTIQPQVVWTNGALPPDTPHVNLIFQTYDAANNQPISFAQSDIIQHLVYNSVRDVYHSMSVICRD